MARDTFLSSESFVFFLLLIFWIPKQDKQHATLNSLGDELTASTPLPKKKTKTKTKIFMKEIP